ncbi:MAG: ribosome maturation factor RimM [Alphaproteobacteria bacterium]|nr:ribosome maturation factor RimM [Alphaproteobacteria bacterium]
MFPEGNDRLILIGVVVGVHGVRGDVKLRSFTSVPADIASYGSLMDSAGVFSVEILSLKAIGELFVATLRGVRDRDGAESLRGIELFVPRSRFPETDEDDWYYADLIGIDVVGIDGKSFGTVTAVDDHGAGAFLEVTCSDGSIDFLSFSRRFVPHVDISAGRLIVTPPDDFMLE